MEAQLDTIDIRKILELLPHRYPFLLVDRVLSITRPADMSSRVGTKIVALKNVTFNEPFFPGHFPGLPVMPGVLQIEAMAQASCLAFIQPGDPPRDYFLSSVQDAKFRKLVMPGDQMMLHGEIIKDRGRMLMVKCEARVNDVIVSEATMLAAVSPKADRNK